MQSSHTLSGVTNPGHNVRLQPGLMSRDGCPATRGSSLFRALAFYRLAFLHHRRWQHCLGFSTHFTHDLRRILRIRGRFFSRVTSGPLYQSFYLIQSAMTATLIHRGLSIRADGLNVRENLGSAGRPACTIRRSAGRPRRAPTHCKTTRIAPPILASRQNEQASSLCSPTLSALLFCQFTSGWFAA